MKRIAYLAPFAVAALIAGCGSSSSSSSAASSAAPPAAAGGNQLAVSETEFKITPASATVAHTGTITITVKNNGKVTHALAVQTPSGVVRTDDIAPGGTATLTVNVSQAGRYVFYCPIDGHRTLGMQGTLVVGTSAGGAASGASTSSSSSSSSAVYGY
jgi:uncharacterized cupredoxin-like copper-binding protein